MHIFGRTFLFDRNSFGALQKNVVSIFRVVSLFATDVLMWIYYFILW